MDAKIQTTIELIQTEWEKKDQAFCKLNGHAERSRRSVGKWSRGGLE